MTDAETRQQRYRELRRARQPVADDRAAYLIVEQLLQAGRRREIYGATPPRDGLCAFDAHGMDVVEGRA